MALLTTFATTPLVSWLYPPWYQKKMELWRAGEIDWDTGEPTTSPSNNNGQDGTRPQNVARLLVYLRLDTMPRLLRLLSLFGDSSTTTVGDGEEADTVVAPALRAHGIRLLELTDRDSSVMTVAQVDKYSRHDPVVNTFQTMGQLHRLAVSGEVAVMPEHRFAQALLTKSTAMGTDLLLVPWSETGSIVDSQILSSSAQADKLVSPYTPFVTSILDAHEHNVAVFFTRSDQNSSNENIASDKGKLVRQYSFAAMRQDFPIATVSRQPYHIFMIYIGGSDDDFALQLVMQLCESSQATATILRADTRAASSSSSETILIDSVIDQISTDLATRVKFEQPDGLHTVDDIIRHASTNYEISSQRNKSCLIVTGRHAGTQLEEGKAVHHPAPETKHCLGAVASQVVEEFVEADVLIVQAGKATELTSIKEGKNV